MFVQWSITIPCCRSLYLYERLAFLQNTPKTIICYMDYSFDQFIQCVAFSYIKPLICHFGMGSLKHQLTPSKIGQNTLYRYTSAGGGRGKWQPKIVSADIITALFFHCCVNIVFQCCLSVCLRSDFVHCGFFGFCSFNVICRKVGNDENKSVWSPLTLRVLDLLM